MPGDERRRITAISIPAPPNHWVSERQNRIEYGRLSGLTVERPVVVKPDTDSNTASNGER